MQINERLLIADGCPSPPCTTLPRTWVSSNARKATWIIGKNTLCFVSQLTSTHLTA